MAFRGPQVLLNSVSLIRFNESAQMTLYVPLAQQPAPTVVLVARASTNAEAFPGSQPAHP